MNLLIKSLKQIFLSASFAIHLINLLIKSLILQNLRFNACRLPFKFSIQDLILAKLKSTYHWLPDYSLSVSGSNWSLVLFQRFFSWQDCFGRDIFKGQLLTCLEIPPRESRWVNLFFWTSRYKGAPLNKQRNKIWLLSLISKPKVIPLELQLLLPSRFPLVVLPNTVSEKMVCTIAHSLIHLPFSILVSIPLTTRPLRVDTFLVWRSTAARARFCHDFAREARLDQSQSPSQAPHSLSLLAIQSQPSSNLLRDP